MSDQYHHAMSSDEASGDRRLQQTLPFQHDEFPDSLLCVGEVVIPSHQPRTIHFNQHSDDVGGSTVTPMDFRWVLAIVGSMMVGATLLGVVQFVSCKSSDGTVHRSKTAKTSTATKSKVSTPKTSSKAASVYSTPKQPASVSPNSSTSPLDLDQYTDSEMDVPDLVVEENTKALVPKRSTKQSHPSTPLPSKGAVFASPNELSFATPMAVTTTMESAEDVLQKMKYLELAAAKAGLTLNQADMLQWAISRQTAEIQVNASLAQEWRHYHYDNGQRTVDREISQQQHEETIELALSDKDWWTKLNASMATFESTTYQSMSLSVLAIVLLDVTSRLYNFYQVITSISKLLCYNVEGSFLSSLEGKWAPYFGSALDCGLVSAWRTLVVALLCGSVGLGCFALRRVGTPERLLHVLRLAYILGVMARLGWLPTFHILVVGSGFFLILYGLAYALVRWHYGLVRAKFQALGTSAPPAKLLTQELMWLDDATFAMQVAPVIGGALWCLVLHLVF